MMAREKNLMTNVSNQPSPFGLSETQTTGVLNDQFPEECTFVYTKFMRCNLQERSQYTSYIAMSKLDHTFPRLISFASKPCTSVQFATYLAANC